MSSPGIEIWGLTGGIAAGKSQAARIFAEEGVPVLDADEVARDLRRPGGPAHGPILKRFGTDDPARLRAIVFADEVARRDLETILHPLIRDESLKRMQLLARRWGGPPPARVIYEAALLVETGRYKQFAGLIVVDAPREVRRKRLIERDGATPELADQILAAQTGDEQRLQAATVVIRNDSSVEHLRREIREWISRMGWR